MRGQKEIILEVVTNADINGPESNVMVIIVCRDEETILKVLKADTESEEETEMRECML